MDGGGLRPFAAYQTCMSWYLCRKSTMKISPTDDEDINLRIVKMLLTDDEDVPYGL